jgi:lipopolysaccharide/colanic/teichoic acid biosynthesis glycosyltransferase
MYELGKRILDLVSASVVFIIFSPLFIIIPILIKLDSPGPVFYKQGRVGKDNQEFWLYKFRTMVTNADEILINDLEFRKRFKKKTGWKVQSHNDPRITKTGKFLRDFSLDELPQLLNIFSGEMSMVGPRAYRRDLVGDEITEQLKIYPKLKKQMELALTVKPGLTGPWQTSGRNELSWEERVKLDAKYARKKSLLYDIFIILKTPQAMLSKW